MQTLNSSHEIPEILRDLRSLTPEKLPDFCAEQRRYLIDTILERGGHFSANLGTVELTVALHYVLNTPDDQLVWDVGHQAYLHKILTGRKNEFVNIRHKGGLSGFPKRSESAFDVFGTGHSSTSISAVLGLSEADLLLRKERQHVAIIGDGSLTGGMAWEALNNAAVSKTNILIIINDNQMGIDPNAGALNHYLNNINADSNFFIDLGFRYDFTPNGHDVNHLVDKLQELVTIDGPKVWHIKTIKGKGYLPAEQEQTKWHAVKYVKIPREKNQHRGDRFQDVFGETLLELAKEDERVVGVTPAMPSGSSMKIMMDALPDRVFDVGIAEQHAVTFSAGMAVNGLVPYCNIYSTFLQRAYDQVIHDICLQNLHVVFCLDRAGVVGEDGPTHHGLYDLAYLRNIPNLTIMVPADELELRQMMFVAKDLPGPVAIRYPRGRGSNGAWRQAFEKISLKAEQIIQGQNVHILAIGVMTEVAIAATQMLAPEHEIAVSNMRMVKPLDTDHLNTVFETYDTIITLEDGCLPGGFGSAVAEYAALRSYKGKLIRLAFPDEIIDHAERSELLAEYGLDASGVAQKIKEIIRP